MLATYQNGSYNISEYVNDDNRNITSITRNSTVAVSYQYNGANELVRENNHTNSYTMTYEYDSWGNLKGARPFAANVYWYITAGGKGANRPFFELIAAN